MDMDKDGFCKYDGHLLYKPLVPVMKIYCLLCRIMENKIKIHIIYPNLLRLQKYDKILFGYKDSKSMTNIDPYKWNLV